MTQVLTGLLVDPFTRSITEAKIASDSRKADALILIGSEDLTVFPLTEVDHCVVDPVAIPKPGMAFWGLKDDPLVRAGKAFILGNEPGGAATTDVNLTVEELTDLVVWLDLEYVGAETVDLGPVMTVHGPGNGYAVVPRFQEKSQPVAPPEVKETVTPRSLPHAWSIIQSPEGFYKATLFEVRDGITLKLRDMENEDLDELREMIGVKPTWTFVPPGASDSIEQVETYILPLPH